MTIRCSVAVALIAGSLTTPAGIAAAQSTAGATVAEGKTRPMGRPFSGRLSTTTTRDAAPSTQMGMLYAVLDGKGKLAVNGTFSQLASPAKTAHLHRGANGERGPKVATLTVTSAASGVLKGDVMLTPDDIAELEKGAYYVEVVTDVVGSEVRGWLISGMLK